VGASTVGLSTTLADCSCAAEASKDSLELDNNKIK
jgi:hypothetical protein